MAKAVISNIISSSAKRITPYNYPKSKITGTKRSAEVIGRPSFETDIVQYNYPKSKIIGPKRTAEITSTLPFRVRFVNVGIEVYGASNPAPIGITIVGFNNYIL